MHTGLPGAREDIHVLRASSFPGKRPVFAYLAVVLTIALMLSVSPWALAEEIDSEDPAEETAAPLIVEEPEPPANIESESPPAPEPHVAPQPEQPAAPEPPVEPEPVEPPAPEPPVEPEPEHPIVSEPPVEPEPEQPPAPDGPIVPEPVETVPADPEVQVTEEAKPTETPEPTVTPTPKPTATPSPTPQPSPTPSPTPEPSSTPEPTPVVTWSQTEPVSCALRDGQPAGLEYAESRTYRCEVSANVSSDLGMPDDMEIEWTLNVDFPDSHTLQFPRGSHASVIQQVPSGTATKYTIAHPWQKGSEQKLAFEIVVTRNTCAVGQQVLSVQANPDIETRESEAEIKRHSGNSHPRPARLVSPVIDSEAPDVAFDGPITFSSVGATAMGLESNLSSSSATVVVTGSWDPCTTWTVNLSGTVDVPAETPAQFRAISINNEPISGDACEPSAPCDVIVLPQTGDAATPIRYSIGLELQLHELTPVGNFGIGLTSDVHGERTQP